MLNRAFRRVLIGMIFAVPVTATSAAFTMTHNLEQFQQTGTLQCSACHESFDRVWRTGAHANALSNPVFQEVWQTQGKPGGCLACHAGGGQPGEGMAEAEGIRCQACHSPVPEAHPRENMPVDRSSEMCAECHTATHFDFQVSTHSQVELACLACHDPHTTDIRAVDASSLCASCHESRVTSFTHSAHDQAGLDCADCHLPVAQSAQADYHTGRDHSFNVQLETCTSCHDFHAIEGAQAPGEASQTEVTQNLATADLSLSPEPDPVSPLGFSVVSGLFGMAAGMILAPWLERWYRRLGRDGE